MSQTEDDIPLDLVALEKSLRETNEVLKGAYREMLAARDQVDALQALAAQVAAERQTIFTLANEAMAEISGAMMLVDDLSTLRFLRRAHTLAQSIARMVTMAR
jgi:hypothetical protein